MSAALRLWVISAAFNFDEITSPGVGVGLGGEDATRGELLCLTRPIYGGTGNPYVHGSRFDEPGFIAIPDCFWGDAAFGLEPPPDLSGVPLHMVKTCNATYGHYGEMAGGQPFTF